MGPTVARRRCVVAAPARGADGTHPPRHERAGPAARGRGTPARGRIAMSRRKDSTRRPVRTALVLALLCLGLLLLAGRALHLQVLDSDFLQVQGQARHSRVVKDNSHRGMILDRNGAPLAVSTPVDSVWAHPPTLIEAGPRLPELAAPLGLNTPQLAKLF